MAAAAVAATAGKHEYFRKIIVKKDPARDSVAGSFFVRSLPHHVRLDLRSPGSVVAESKIEKMDRLMRFFELSSARWRY